MSVAFLVNSPELSSLAFAFSIITEGVNFALGPHPNWPVIYGHICLQGNFLVSQVAGCRCSLLAGNSSISPCWE